MHCIPAGDSNILWGFAMTAPAGHLYEVRQRKDKRGVDLISDALPFGRLWWREPNAVSNAIDYAKFRQSSDDRLRTALRDRTVMRRSWA